jgi:hypothetical protein
VDFDEIRQTSDAIEGDLYATFFNLVASAIAKWRTLNF